VVGVLILCVGVLAPPAAALDIGNQLLIRIRRKKKGTGRGGKEIGAVDACLAA
jgi:hypothetical protein